VSRRTQLSLRRERVCVLSPAALQHVAGAIAPGDKAPSATERCHQTLLCPPEFTRPPISQNTRNQP
jgi:hypothetical protein